MIGWLFCLCFFLFSTIAGRPKLSRSVNSSLQSIINGETAGIAKKKKRNEKPHPSLGTERLEAAQAVVNPGMELWSPFWFPW